MVQFVQHRRGSKAALDASGEVPAAGELYVDNFDTSNPGLKVGDGLTQYVNLPYLARGGSSLPDGVTIDGGVILAPGITTAAQDWKNRVEAAGGTVSNTTLYAVAVFDQAIKDAGIRDRFYRLNLFCGDDFTGCRTPLYRGPVEGGTEYGSVVDTNPTHAGTQITASDYSESGGLNNTTSGRLSTDFAFIDAGLENTASLHLSAYVISPGTATGGRLIGRTTSDPYTELDGKSFNEELNIGTTLGDIVFFVGGTGQTRVEGSISSGSFVVGSSEPQTADLFIDGTPVDSDPNPSQSALGHQGIYYIFARNLSNNNNRGPFNRSDAPVLKSDSTLGSYSIGLSLTASQAADYSAAMAVFQQTLGRASDTHFEALAWAKAVEANLGSVSAATLAAVSQFCYDIEAAGLRDKFYRLNLFAGSNRLAAAVPLYRGPAYDGTTYGYDVDSFVNYWSDGNYTEPGAGGGLTGGNARYLDTGLSVAALPSFATGHLSVFRGAGDTPNDTFIGLRSADSSERYEVLLRGDQKNDGVWGQTIRATPPAARPEYDLAQFLLLSRTASNELSFYSDGVLIGSNSTATTPGSATGNFFVFARNDGGNGVAHWPGVISCYSVGDGLSASQQLAFYNAVTAFQSAIGR